MDDSLAILEKFFLRDLQTGESQTIFHVQISPTDPTALQIFVAGEGRVGAMHEIRTSEIDVYDSKEQLAQSKITE
jgi:hypothetical protein